MIYSIILSFIGEGSTDHKFLPNITERIIEASLLAQNKQATIQWFPINKIGNSARDIIINAAEQAKYCTTLVLHSDADDRNPNPAFINKIKPGIDAVFERKDMICKNITIVIPIIETEAWMLVDKNLLKEEMNTELSNTQLGLDYPLKNIEKIGDPKQKLLTAINIHYGSLTRKRRKNSVKIAELYEPISQQVDLQKLEILRAYQDFKKSLINALKNANILD